jgi:hypothetical protein
MFTVRDNAIEFSTGGVIQLPFIGKSHDFVTEVKDFLDSNLELIKVPDADEEIALFNALGMDDNLMMTRIVTDKSYDFLSGEELTSKELGQVVALASVNFWYLSKKWALAPDSEAYLAKLQDLVNTQIDVLIDDDDAFDVCCKEVIDDVIRGFHPEVTDDTVQEDTLPDMSIISDAILSKLTKDQQDKLIEMAKIIAEINGQDAYSVTAMSLGKLNVREYLLLPKTMKNIHTPYKDVGKPWKKIRPDIDMETIAQIYTLNKKANMDVKDPVMFALIRLEAVKMGWARDQREISWVDPDPEALTTLIADRDEVTSKTEVARVTAFLIPLMAENVFRISGHHYLSGMSDEYDRKYQTIANATLCANITSVLRPSELYHRVLHWVSPAVARRVLLAQLTLGTIPNAIELRADAAPAGTAIVTTTLAVIDAMRASQIAAEIEKYGNFDLDKVAVAAAVVKSNVTGFHQAYYAYNVPKASASDLAIFEAGKLEAIRFAPIAQGFIDAYHQNGALANARALRKYAENAPVLAKRALRVFKNLSKQDTESIAQLFQVAPEDKIATPTPAPTAVTPVVV